MSMLIEVWGDYACFSRPEMKSERVSYDVMTPSAARGLVEAIYWHPGLKFTVDRIYVLSPIRFTNIRRNEVKATLLASAALSAAKGGTPPVLYTTQEIQQLPRMAGRNHPRHRADAGSRLDAVRHGLLQSERHKGAVLPRAA